MKKQVELPDRQSSSPHLSIGGPAADHPSMQHFMQALYSQQLISPIAEPNFALLDTYVIVYLCAYDMSENFLMTQSIHHIKDLLKNPLLRPETSLVVIFLRDLKVAFPERKLQREKFMSEMNSEEILKREQMEEHPRLHIIHEFGTHNLQDTLQQLKGSHLYFEAIALLSQQL